MLKPGRLLDDGLGGKAARVFAFGVGDGQGAEQDTLHFCKDAGFNFDVVAATQRGLANLFSENSRVDAELLRGVVGKLVAG